MAALSGCVSESSVTKQTGPDSKDPDVSTEDTGSDSEPDDTQRPDDPPCSQGTPIIEVGPGDTLFEPIEDGDTIEVIHGAQDGHHILGSIRARNTTSVAVIHFQIVSEYSGEPVSNQVYRIQLLPDPTRGDCAWIITGLFAYLGRIDPAGAEFLDQAATMQMDLVDDNGRTASDTVSVVPHLPSLAPGG